VGQQGLYIYGALDTMRKWLPATESPWLQVWMLGADPLQEAASDCLVTEI
jgi:hypothetical protein